MGLLTVNEEMLLVTIWSLKENAYGVTIMEKLRDVSGKKIVFGTLYNSLAKLARKGYVETVTGEPTPERGGKSKVYYHLTPRGKLALQQTRAFHLNLWKWLPDYALEKDEYE